MSNTTTTTTTTPSSSAFLVVDRGNDRIQLCPADSPGQPCATVAGGNGKGSGSTQLSYPSTVAIDGNGDYLIVDMGNDRIQLCPADSPGQPCATVAGGNGKGSGSTQLSYPSGVAIDGNGDYLIADAFNHRIQLCPADSPGQPCATVAGGNGGGSGSTQLSAPYGIAIDGNGDYLITDMFNKRIQLCPADSPGQPCATVAGGNGGGSGSTQLSGPSGVAIDGNGDYLIADAYNHRIQLCPADSPGQPCATVAGGNGKGSGSTQLSYPFRVAIDGNGDYLIADDSNHRIQLCPADPPGQPCATVAGGNGRGSGGTQFWHARDVILH